MSFVANSCRQVQAQKWKTHFRFRLNVLCPSRSCPPSPSSSSYDSEVTGGVLCSRRSSSTSPSRTNFPPSILLALAPTTLIARWGSANAQSTIPLLARTITALGGSSSARQVVQIRPFRLPGSQSGTGKASGAIRQDKEVGSESKGDDGRNMYVVRSLGAVQTLVFIEDLTAPLRKEAGEDSLVDDSGEAVRSGGKHTQWTLCALGGAVATVSPFDAFLQRVLLGGGNAPNSGSWLSRSTAVSIDGFVFNLGGTGGNSGDWEIRIGSISVKGGASGGNTRGVVVEATYLPVPYLPENSTYLKDFLSTLFPAPALAAGEIEWITVPEEDFYQVGLVQKADAANGHVEGEWEWSEKHSSYAYLTMLRKEGLL